MEQDTRWHQRLENYSKALGQLEKAVTLSKERELSDLEEQGLIQAFEFTHELSWNLLKDYLIFQGNSSITGSRDATREAFRLGLISDGENWMEMIKSRNQSSHTYNEGIAEEISTKITENYYQLFKELQDKMYEFKAKDE
ncbi:nucleotidyltransferase substrate binding protein [Algoriphagus winogradskyi]|uniref:Nucleotidyltransferase substrate binding protein, HI0074 family n=1 Tax=Algoriphagus winogradskyi TaxID=237017 RepID=A0ABY1NXB4_9BACT|nr:nucleotidyltransferase substrate binding protein [Algoriphagus winogradskyi]SMP20912.1 nucleotidyltransferase substrate binding protein, HI0074 family [Algoriphagus winogradskyi]